MEVGEWGLSAGEMGVMVAFLWMYRRIRLAKL